MNQIFFKPVPNREYKSTVFSLLYNDKDKLLSLYNAMNHSDYQNPEEMQIVTLDNALYIGVKNDKAFVLDYWLNLYEHQSTVNANMPLRDLFYVAKEYAKVVDFSGIYRSSPLRIPTPRFVAFYNGIKKQPERQTLKLSDLYIQPEDDPMLELKVDVLNINAGYNLELKEACKSLAEYCIFVDKVREHMQQKNQSLERAINRAIEECICEDVLRDFLLSHREEVVAMSILEFTYEDWLKIVEEEKEERRLEDEKRRQEDERRRQEDEERRLDWQRLDQARLRLQEERTLMEEERLQALVSALSPILPDFQTLVQAVRSNERYRDFTEEQIKKYYIK